MESFRLHFDIKNFLMIVYITFYFKSEFDMFLLILD